jgi:hypothetical protein
MCEITKTVDRAIDLAFERGYLAKSIEVLQLIIEAYENKLIDEASFITLKNILIKD